MLADVTAMRLADFGNFIPFLFVIYVIYAIFSSMAKAIKQAAQAQQAAQTQAPSATDASGQPQLSAADVRLALQRRLAAAAAARAQAAAAQTAAAQAVQSAQAAARPAPVIVPVSMSATLPDFGSPGDALQIQSLTDASLMPARPAMNLSSLLASLPLAAQAIVAGAVIGPCAAHRGGGHIPEDW